MGQGRVLLPWLLKPEVAVDEGEKPPLTRAEVGPISDTALDWAQISRATAQPSEPECSHRSMSAVTVMRKLTRHFPNPVHCGLPFQLSSTSTSERKREHPPLSSGGTAAFPQGICLREGEGELLGSEAPLSKHDPRRHVHFLSGDKEKLDSLLSLHTLTISQTLQSPLVLLFSCSPPSLENVQSSQHPVIWKEPGVGVGDLDGQLSCPLHDQLPVLGGDVVGDLSTFVQILVIPTSYYILKNNTVRASLVVVRVFHDPILREHRQGLWQRYIAS
ncbi:hypothetical protein INR49_013356 [Caranx melampygus]|nr:hypothetical protein INR49_013356 [Caranx melampygus]